MAPKTHDKDPNIFLFVPNLIGYARIVLGIVSLFFMQDQPHVAMPLYWLSAFLDAFDGQAARYLDQGTHFGKVLDMVSDRCTTMALQMTLCVFYPAYLPYIQLVAILDISSHWVHTDAALRSGLDSHKNMEKTTNWFLRLYYDSRAVLFFMCAANELFFMALYLVHFTPGPAFTLLGHTHGAWVWMGLISFPFCAIKQVLNVIQMINAVRAIGKLDVKDIREKGKKH